MCGRFTLRSNPARVAEAFDLTETPELTPRYNVAPTQQVAAVLADDEGRRRLVFQQWGLIPSWADDPTVGNRMINARAETAADKPSFRRAFRCRRCLIVADGFYEWRKTDDGKQPYYVTLADDRPFGLAGLWEHWQRGELAIDSNTILTTTANDLMRPLHDRMPVILSPDQYAVWLDPRVDDPARLLPLCVPCPSESLRARPVSKAVNNPRHDRPDCIEPLASA